ncbi:MAG: alpha/beta hydrolase [Clostridia bacterium]|nr:alpha/beta hydrolase [Clostridia bacterium]
MISISDLEYKKGLFLDLHLPESREFDLFVYFHGGGLTSGSRKGVEIFAKTLAKRNIATASVDYSLYPNAKFPDFIKDCALSIRWLKDNIAKYGICNRVFVGGSSAGGYISMMLCFDDKYLNGVGLTPTDIAGYIHDAGQPTAHFNVLLEYGVDSRRIIVDKTAPLYFVGLAKKYSPILFIVSDNDLPCRYEQTMLMIKTLERFGYKDSVFLEIVKGNHVEYVEKADENGDGILGNIILKHFDKMITIK